ncbi:MAG: nitrous oxide reductase family maturation protein NosD [Aquificae bacterium]|nr:nitrous oxide reductase family maturation protein NosD [Aquificota bacterium]
MGRPASPPPHAPLLLTLLLAALSFAQTLVVCKDCRITSIKKALELAKDGDTILVKGGTYREGTIVVNKRVRLVGEGYPTLDGQRKYEVLKVTADGVTVEGFRIVNSGVSELEDLAGLKVEGASGCVIKDNLFENNFWAVYLSGVRGCRVEDNLIKGSGEQSEAYTGNGIHLWHCERVLIRRNRIEGHRDGIYLEFVKDSLILENEARNNWRYGLHFMFSHGNTYARNLFERNGAGVAVMYTKKVVMVNNTFRDNWGDSSYGLLLKAITDSLVVNNRFYRNTVGILMDECQRTLIKENDFVENGWAVKLWANSANNTITYNNFLANTFDFATNSRRSENELRRNYWSAYRGYDLNRDGIGDVPYKPVKLFAYIVENNPAASVLLKSPLVELLNLAEEAFPALTAVELKDPEPLLRRVEWRFYE